MHRIMRFYPINYQIDIVMNTFDKLVNCNKIDFFKKYLFIQIKELIT